MPETDTGTKIEPGRRRSPEHDPAHPGASRPTRLVAGAVRLAFVLVAIFVAVRMGAFDLSASVVGPDGPLRLPNGFAGVDHPFHAARAETLRRSLAAGDPLRWVANHQGGYPVEFYPLGVAWLEVGLWALLLGALPMVTVHKLAVLLIFLLPGVAFVLLARQDRWPWGIPLVAFAAHVAVPGGWWHGGYTELVQWGLVTNVAAAVALLFVLAWLTEYLTTGRPLAAVGAASTAAFAVATNPRSAVALAIVGVAVWLVALIDDRKNGLPPTRATGRLALVAAVGGLLAAPQIVPLLRFSDLYRFVQYERYADAADYLANALQAVGLPLFLLALGGVPLAALLPSRPATRAAAVALLLYAGATLLFTLQPEAAAAVPQLEATRLMPFQRYLTIYLAAAALGAIVSRLSVTVSGGKTRANQATIIDAACLAAIAALLLAYVSPTAAPPPTPAVDEPDRGLYAVATAAQPEQAALERAITAADSVAPPGTALLVLGSALSWHQQLWAPLWTDRPLFYDDWLWYWQPDHAGTPGYRFEQGHRYPDPALALDPAFLARHGIGAVVVTGTAAPAAATSPHLRPIAAGTYAAYLVAQPTPIVTLDGATPTTSTDQGHRITATAATPFQDALVRRNWHPRWRATLDGAPAPIARTTDGYMRIAATRGATELQLDYAVDPWDWLARGLAITGILSAIAIIVGAHPNTRRLPQSNRRPSNTSKQPK